MKVERIDLTKFLTSKFDCPSFHPKDPLIDFDNVRKTIWSQLRSVDALRIEERKIELYELSTFDDLIEILKSTGTLNLQLIEQNIRENLFPEYREKLFESLLLLSLIGRDLNGKFIRFKIGICIERKEDIRFYDTLKRIIEKELSYKLQNLLSDPNDKVIVFLI